MLFVVVFEPDGILGRIRRQLAAFARRRQREDLALLFEIAATERTRQGRVADHAIDVEGAADKANEVEAHALAA
ncbi:integrase (plasmid) [Ralstonia pseudosolanacearum]|uniref:Integrase n=1 Tax=Ralstonia solanacearum TaxID=305 RepID=A0AA92K7H2_RALSL|nr:integrase [Ralstonia pseudosolanacearum]QOK99745.1 integrase [Ralstonia pseudosolanacearum]